MNNNLKSLIQTASELGATAAMVNLGVTAGEKSYRACRDIYGKWFTDAVANNRIFPCRVEEGKCGTKYYSVREILALKVSDYSRCELK